jgi:hypothetical protein
MADHDRYGAPQCGHRIPATQRDPNSTARRLSRAHRSGKFGPFASVSEESPWEWVNRHQIRNVRRFRKGIFRTITATIELVPEGDGTRLCGEFSMESSNLTGTLFLLFGGGDAMIRNYRKFSAAIVPYHLDNGPLPPELAGNKVSAAVRARMTQLVAKIESGPYGHNLARPLAEFIATGPDTGMNYIRPLVLAAE